MSDTPRPQFYHPAFGNDNFYAQDNVDIAAFRTPAFDLKDAAIVAATVKKAEKI